MPVSSFTPNWDRFDLRVGAIVLVAVVMMTLLAVVLIWRAREPKAKMVAKDYGRRAIGWWIILALFAPMFVWPRECLLPTFAILALVGWSEFARLNRTAALRLHDLPWTAAAIGLFFVSLAGVTALEPGAALMVGIGLIAAATALTSRQDWPARFSWRTAGYLILTVSLGAAVLLAFRFGMSWLIFTVVIVQAGDVLQYVCGKAFGQHALAPSLSPRKTWEGLIGGIVGAALLGATMGGLIERRPLTGAALGAAVAAAGTFSGLVMSAAKRRQGAKDFGTWLPGHGGLMDRLDSVCGAALLVYCWLAARS